MQHESHTSEPKNDQRVLRAALERAEAGDVEWSILREAKRAYRAAVNADCIAADKALDKQRFTPAKLKDAMREAHRDYWAARKALVAADAAPHDYTIADYIDLAMAFARAETRYLHIGNLWRGRTESIADNLTAERGSVTDGYTVTGKTVRVDGVRVPIIEATE
jgi:lysozyme family protein